MRRASDADFRVHIGRRDGRRHAVTEPLPRLFVSVTTSARHATSWSAEAPRRRQGEICRAAFGEGPERCSNASAASITGSTSWRPISRTGVQPVLQRFAGGSSCRCRRTPSSLRHARERFSTDQGLAPGDPVQPGSRSHDHRWSVERVDARSPPPRGAPGQVSCVRHARAGGAAPRRGQRFRRVRSGAPNGRSRRRRQGRTSSR
jgi:hypothetical protein